MFYNMDVVHGYKRSASCVYIFIDALQAIFENGKSMKYLSLFKRGLPSSEIYLIFFLSLSNGDVLTFKGTWMTQKQTILMQWTAEESWDITVVQPHYKTQISFHRSLVLKKKLLLSGGIAKTRMQCHFTQREIEKKINTWMEKIIKCY